MSSLIKSGRTLAGNRMLRGNPIRGVAAVAYRRSAIAVRSFVALLALASSVATTNAAMAETSICGGTRVSIDTSVLGMPFANLVLGGSNGKFLIDTGATFSRVDMRRYGLSEGSKIFLSGFSLPSVQSGTFIAADLGSFAAPLGGQLGTVGTDFLSLAFDRIPLQAVAVVRRAWEGGVRPCHAAPRWFCRSWFTKLLRSRC
jgi:hypothetical protein